jgi:hypothetical protein
MTLPPATMYRWSASVSAPSGRSSPPRSVRARPGRLRALSVSAKIYMDLRAWSTLYGVFDGCAGRLTVLFGGFRPGQSVSWSKRASFKIDGWCEARRFTFETSLPQTVCAGFNIYVSTQDPTLYFVPKFTSRRVSALTFTATFKTNPL